MTRTITALFDQRHDAEAAKERLKQSRVDADHVHIHDKSSAGYREGSHSTASDPGVWASIKNAFLPDEDRHTYEEGIRRGGYLLTADVDEDSVDEAVRVLEEANSVDIDERAQQWRSSGWDYAGTGMGSGATAAYGLSGSDTDRRSTGAGDEQVIPVAEEQLAVGKREVNRGGVRVRSYVTERPVHEQVRLRDEHVDVQRRPVDRAVDEPVDDAFVERTIDVSATGEEAVVGKTARVVEEVVVTKTSGERVEDIDDSVRKTEVDIDRDATDTRRDRDVAGTNRDRDDYRG